MTDIRDVEIVRVWIEDDTESGLLVAKSDDLPGLLVAGRNMEELEQEVPEVIRAMFHARGLEVTVRRARRTEKDYMPWAAIPVEIAAAALEHV